MTENIPESTLKLLENEDDFKNKAPLYILYDKLNSVSNTYNISTSCTKLNSNNVIQPCRVLEETLKKWTIDSTLTNPEIVTDVTKYCTHVVYWLYGKIIDIPLNNSDINTLYSYVPKLLGNKCSTDIKSNIKKVYNKKTLKNKKELYDFLESYDTIEGIIKEEKSKHIQDYCEYIKYIFDLYNNIHQDYNSIQSGYYDEEIKKFEDKFKNGENKFSILSNKCPKDYLYSVINRVNETFQNSGQKKPKTNDKITFESFNAIKEKNTWKETKLYEFYKKLDDDYNAACKSGTCDCSPYHYLKDNTVVCTLWGKLQNIIDNWDSLHANRFDLGPKKTCDHLYNWLYGKFDETKASLKDIHLFYYEWQDLFHKRKIKKCYNKNFFNLGIDQLAYKKQLYEFVENYPIIKKELETAGNTDKKEYCDYIKDIFGLYKKVSHPYTSYGYNEEINSFNKKFLKNYREFHFLNEKCPGNCLHLVFNNNYKDLCLSEEQLKYVQDVPTSCTSAENSTADPIGIPDYNLDFYNHYNGFDDNSNLSEYAKFCNKMDSFWSKYTNGKNFCYQIVRNLINLSLSQQDGRDERCLYFTYWIYDTIWKHFGKGYNDTCVSDVIHMLLNFVSRINRDLVNTICYLEYYSDVSLKEWKEMKYLHDYFKGYSSFTNGNFNDDGKKQKLCDYITHANKLYKEHIQKCCVCVNKPKFSCYDKCPKYFKCDKTYYPYDLLTNLSCAKDQTSEHIDTLFEPVIFDPKYITDIPKPVSDVKAVEYTFEYLTSDPFYLASSSAFVFIGMCFFFFFFYKFTPIGIWINRRLEGKGRIQSMHHNSPVQMPPAHASKAAKRTPQRERIRIAYHTS
ncbi:VIR protein [Plasmodium vivax]|uniref:VIR protein n=1 Tax=Plasmodium vivax TaxID=5855 RepID=A0A1G4GT38_PLAVI|nr:VIR protein [Plasmodium vivax]